MLQELDFESVNMPFYIGEEIEYWHDESENLPQEILDERGALVGTVISYAIDYSYITLRYGYWDDENNYKYRFFNIYRNDWNKIEEYVEDDEDNEDY